MHIKFNICIVQIFLVGILVGFLCNCLTSCSKNLGHPALYRGGEVGGGVVVNELSSYMACSVPSTI